MVLDARLFVELSQSWGYLVGSLATTVYRGLHGGFLHELYC